MSQVAVENTRSSGHPRWLALWRRYPINFRVGAVILSLHLLVAIVGFFWSPYGLAQMGTGIPLSGPSWVHLFGVDQLGRDIFSRVIRGSHIVLALSFFGTTLGFALGAMAGLLSGYLRGWIDELLQRGIEVIVSIPFLVLALIAMTAAGTDLSGNPVVVILVVAFVYAPRVARMARATALDIVSRDFVTVARLRGDSPWSVMRRELLPNATSVLFVEFALRAGYAPILIGSLGFLGFGLRPPSPEWGLMISENRSLIIVSPFAVVGPGLMLASLVVGLNLFTEGLARILGRTVRLGEQ